HGCHHHAHAAGACAFQAVQFREQIAIKAALFFAAENHVRIVDKNDRWRVTASRRENAIDLSIETVRTRDYGSVYDEKFSFKPMSQRPANCCLAGPRRSGKQYASFRLQI